MQIFFIIVTITKNVDFIYFSFWCNYCFSFTFSTYSRIEIQKDVIINFWFSFTLILILNDIYLVEALLSWVCVFFFEEGRIAINGWIFQHPLILLSFSFPQVKQRGCNKECLEMSRYAHPLTYDPYRQKCYTQKVFLIPI